MLEYPCYRDHLSMKTITMFTACSTPSSTIVSITLFSVTLYVAMSIIIISFQGEVLHHTEEESDLTSLDTSYEGDRSSGYASTGQLPVEGLDERASVTPTVFSSDSDEDNSTLPTLEPALPPLSRSTPARQLSDIPEVENTSSHPASTTETPDNENMPASMPPTDQHVHESDSTTNTSSSNMLFYGTTIAVAGALIYNKLNY